MKINFLFQENVGDVPNVKLSASNIISCPHNTFCPEDKLEFGPIVARGNFAFQRALETSLRMKNWPQLTWPFNQKATSFGYSNWFTYYDGWQSYYEFMLNEDIEMYFCGTEPITASLLLKKWDLFQFNCDKIWIRSEAGSKQFAGGLFSKEDFEKECEYLKQENAMEEWLVISSPKKLGKE